MNSDSLLLIAFGLLCGFSLGWVTSWRLARKLEHHGVQLWRWDKPLDLQAAPDNVARFERQSAR